MCERSIPPKVCEIIVKALTVCMSCIGTLFKGKPSGKFFGETIINQAQLPGGQ